MTIGLGVAAGSLALIAFGLDSLVEVFASLVVIWHMGPGEAGQEAVRSRRAMRLVGVAFALSELCLRCRALRRNRPLRHFTRRALGATKSTKKNGNGR